MSNARLLVLLVYVLAPLLVQIAWLCIVGGFTPAFAIGVLVLPTAFILSLIVGIASGVRGQITESAELADSDNEPGGNSGNER